MECITRRAGWEIELMTTKVRLENLRKREESRSKSEPSSPVHWPDERKSEAQSSNSKRKSECPHESLCRIYPYCIKPRCKYYPCWTMIKHKKDRLLDSPKKRHKFEKDAQSKSHLKLVDSATTSAE